MKTYKLKVPVSTFETEIEKADQILRETNYFSWRWVFLDEIISTFAEAIRKNFNFSYNDYYEYRDGDEYSFKFCVDSLTYFVLIFEGEDKGDSIEYKMEFEIFEEKKFLFFTRRVESKRHYENLKEVILKTIQKNNFIISEA